MSCERDSSPTTDPTEADTCPGCGATDSVQPQPAPPTVEAWSCTECGMQWACTVVNPALSIIGLLPTPQRRTAAFLALLRTEVTRRGKGYPVISSVCLPATEVISIDGMASVDTVLWRCRLCERHGTATTRPTAHCEGVEHLSAEHYATIGTAP